MPLRRFLLLCLPLMLWAQSPEQEKILDVMRAQQAAWNRGDIDAFMEGYERSDKIAFVGTEVLHGYDAVKARYHRKYGDRAKMGTLQFSDFEVRLLTDETAVVIGRFHLTRSEEGGGDASGIFTVVFLKTDQGWKVVHDHTS